MVYIHSFTPGLDFTLEVALIQCLRAHSCLFWIDRLPSPDEATTSTVEITITCALLMEPGERGAEPRNLAKEGSASVLGFPGTLGTRSERRTSSCTRTQGLVFPVAQ